MSKRELPPRSNRGKNPFYTLEIEKNHDEKTKATPISSKKASSSIVKELAQKKIKFSGQARRQIFNENKRNFIFTRGIHYFYDLNQLQRVPQSISYAFFPSKKERKMSKYNNYTINFSKDYQENGNTTIGSLINRNLVGLPLQKQPQKIINNQFQFNDRTLDEVLEMKRSDKNQCHHYLFEAEDKKHNLDRMILQLQFINKRLDFFLLPKNIKKLQQFSLIEKDAELSEIFFQNSDIKIEEKKQILEQKIEILKQKRQSLNLIYQNVADTYYLNSLNQKLFNQVKIQKQKLNRFNIYQQMQTSMKQHRLDHIKSQKSVILDNFHQESSFSRYSQMDDYFCIDEKVFNHFVMENTFKIISIRLFHEGQNCFYFGKKIFSKLFNKQLQLQKQIKSITLQPYKGKIKQIEECLQKYCKKQQKLQTQQNLQGIKNLRIEKVKRMSKNVKKNEIKITMNERIVPIEFYEYYCLKIFTEIYEALKVVEQFLKRSENKKLNVIQHLASLYYSKFQNRLLNITQNPKFGLLSIALDKLVEVITHKNKQFETMNYELFVQFIEKDRKIITFVKQIQSECAQESSSTLKRQRSFSQILIQSRQNQLLDEEIFQHGRKMIK